MDDDWKPRKPRYQTQENQQDRLVDVIERGYDVDCSSDEEDEVVEDGDAQGPHGEETSQVGEVVDVYRGRTEN